MKCPYCRESIPMLGAAKACPHCGKAIETEAGEKVRPIDLDYDALLAAADTSSLLWTKRGAVFAFVLALFSIVPGPGALLAHALLVIGQFLWTGFLVARPYHRHFSPMRRLVARWVRRLSITFLVLPLYTVLHIPVVGLIAAPGIFFGTCWLVRAYARFHFVREKNRVPVTWAEKLLVVVLALLVLGGLCVTGLLVYLSVNVLDMFGK